MGRPGIRAFIGKAAYCAGALLLLSLPACEPFWNAPEARAQDFIEALVTEPGDTSHLHELANDPPDHNPEDLLDDLSARVGVDFLRAKQAQGVTLSFTQTESRRIDSARRAVTVRVSFLPTGAPMDSEVRFKVQVEKNDQGRWRIVRVKGDN